MWCLDYTKDHDIQRKPLLPYRVGMIAKIPQTVVYQRFAGSFLHFGPLLVPF